MRIYIVLIFFALCAIACKKGASVSPSLFGKWELRREYGGFSYRDSIYKPGNGTYYQFNSDSTYKRYIQNKLQAQGIFHIRKFDNSNQLIYFDNLQYSEPFSRTGTIITIGTTVTDGIASEYQKISN